MILTPSCLSFELTAVEEIISVKKKSAWVVYTLRNSDDQRHSKTKQR